MQRHGIDLAGENDATDTPSLTGIQEYGSFPAMKATIDIPDELYRKVKAKSALEGRPVRDVTVQLFREWVSEADAARGSERAKDSKPSKPPWLGALRAYAKNARGRHDMKSIRNSIARGRVRDELDAGDDHSE